MSARTALARSAILGTQHAAPVLVAGDPEAAALIATAADEGPERALLQAAAVFATIKRAHYVPRRFERRETAALDEVLPRCGPLAAADLRDILAGDRSEFLTEWLDLAIRFGKRCPEELLPKLLGRGAADANVRGAVVRVLGERGRWLATHESRWRYAIEAAGAAAAFEESSELADRVRALKQLRTEDPARARELLEAAWPKEAAADRQRLLAALVVNLSPDDETFLERLRGEKRKDDRAAANAMLHRLPRSQAAGRASALAARYLAFERGLPGRIVVALPEYTPDLAAEGVEDVHRAGTGDRSALFAQLLTFVPIDFWLDTFGVSVEKLFELARAHEFADALGSGFAGAIAAYRNAAARDALFSLAARDDAYVDVAVAAGFSDATRIPEAPFIDAFHANQPRATEFVALASRPWSPRLSSLALQAAWQGLERNVEANVHFGRRAFFRLLAANVSPETPNVLPGPSHVANVTAQTLADHLSDVLSFRFAMYEHLKDGT